MIQYLGEFLGTFILVLLGDGVVAGNVLSKTKEEGCYRFRLGDCLYSGGLCIWIFQPSSLESSGHIRNGFYWSD